MTKRKYLKKLKKALGKIPKTEKEEIVDYYAEIIDELYERGKTTREIFASLGTPEQAASDYFNENEGPIIERKHSHGKNYSLSNSDTERERIIETSSQHKEKKKPNIWLIVLLFPIWLPLLIIGFALALAVSITIIALLVGVVAIVIACGVAGLYCLVASFGLIPAHGALATTQIGAAVVLFGLSMLFGLIVKPLSKGVGAFFRLIFRKKGSSTGSVMQSKWVAVLVVGMIFIIGGGSVGVCTFQTALGGDWHNLAVVGTFTEQTKIIELDAENLSLVSDNLRIEVVSTEEENARLVYFESEEFKLNYTCENGAITIKNGEWSNNPLEYFKQTWKRGVMFSTVISAYARATLYLPINYKADLSLKVNNGMLSISGFDGETVGLKNVTLSTDNGKIKVNNVNAEKLIANTNNGHISLNCINANAVEVKTDNGYIELKNIVANTVSGVTHNGAISCERVKGEVIELSTNNGAINGTIVGQESDFKISAKVSNGHCNLSNKETGDKTLKVKTGNGAIKLSFVI